jgi:sigma-B regulation protein RsbU (phosphoserine phosphatase)
MAALTVDGDALKAVCDKVLEIYYSVPMDEVVLSDDWGSDEFNAYIAKFESVYDMPEFKKVHEQLSQTQNLGISTLSSVYTEIYDFGREANNALYLVDAAPEEDACPPGVTEHVEDADWDSVKSGLGHDPYLTNTEMYGWLVTAASPVYDSSGKVAALVAVDLDMNEIKANEQSFITMLTLILVSMTAVICIITLVVISHMIVTPIKKLSVAAAGYVSNSEKNKFSTIRINNSDEIGGLSEAMKKMESDINDYVDNIAAITAEKERVTAELSVAAKMQADMLPTEFPDRSDIKVFATMTPAREMGGDFYDFFMIDDDHIGLVMADVSGKGMPAAMFMIVSRTLIKIHTVVPGSPAEILLDVNNTLCEDNPAGLFVTAWLGVLTLSTGELIWANAGHEYPAIMHKGGDYVLIKSDNMPPLATIRNIDYVNETIQLQKGDRLFLYTDGVPEAKAPDGSRFGTDRMLEVLNSCKDLSPEELLKAVKRDTDVFSGENEPFDDITMMCIEWNGK